MRVHTTARLATFAALVGALACASNKARTEDTTQPDQAAAARDTSTTRDTLSGQAENPSGYHGMERDTTQAPPSQQTPTDTFLQNQGQGQPQDTAGYSGMERVDTTGQAQPGQAQPGQTDTTGFGRDTSAAGADTSAMGQDTSGLSRTGDTTGYNPSQQTGDTTGR